MPVTIILNQRDWESMTEFYRQAWSEVIGEEVDLRERIDMLLRVWIAQRHNWLAETAPSLATDLDDGVPF